MTAVQYDELGFPSIPESWVMLWEVDVQSVHDLRDGRLTLKPRAQPLLLCNGAVGRFVSGALVRFPFKAPNLFGLTCKLACTCELACVPASEQLAVPTLHSPVGHLATSDAVPFMCGERRKGNKTHKCQHSAAQLLLELLVQSCAQLCCCGAVQRHMHALDEQPHQVAAMLAYSLLALQSVVGLRDGGNAEEAQLADQVYLDWCRRHGETYRRHYGRVRRCLIA